MQLTFDIKELQIIKEYNKKIEEDKKFKESIRKHLLKAEDDISTNILVVLM